MDIDDIDIDLWMFGATSQVSSQFADYICKLGQESGISTLIPDWASTDIPPMAVAPGMSETIAAEFLEVHVKEMGTVSKILITLKTIKNNKGYSVDGRRFYFI